MMRIMPDAASVVPAAVDDADRLAAVRATGLLDTPAAPAFDDLARLAGRLLGAPLAFVTLIDDQRSFWKSYVGGSGSQSSRR
jgi:hypothetical protein